MWNKDIMHIKNINSKWCQNEQRGWGDRSKESHMQPYQCKIIIFMREFYFSHFADCFPAFTIFELLCSCDFAIKLPIFSHISSSSLFFRITAMCGWCKAAAIRCKLDNWRFISLCSAQCPGTHCGTQYTHGDTRPSKNNAPTTFWCSMKKIMIDFSFFQSLCASKNMSTSQT